MAPSFDSLNRPLLGDWYHPRETPREEDLQDQEKVSGVIMSNAVMKQVD